jgi:hypothetical protein
LLITIFIGLPFFLYILHISTSVLNLHRDAGVATEHVDHLDAGGIFSFLRIFVIPEIAHRFQAAVLSCAIILPVVLKGFTLAPIKVHCPEINKIKTAKALLDPG